MQGLIAQTNRHTQEQTALVKREVERATHELQQQTSAKDAEIEQLRRVAETNDRRIEEPRQQANTATQAAQAAQSAAEASHVGAPTELQMMLAAMQEMVAEVRSMRDEIINKKQKIRHIDCRVQASDRGFDKGNLLTAEDKRENRVIYCMSNLESKNSRRVHDDGNSTTLHSCLHLDVGHFQP